MTTIPGPWDGWRYYQEKTAYAKLRIYEEGIENFNTLYSFALVGDEARISVSKNKYLYFPVLKIDLNDFDLSPYNVKKLEDSVMFVTGKDSDPGRNGMRYIELSVYEDDYLKRYGEKFL